MNTNKLILAAVAALAVVASGCSSTASVSGASSASEAAGLGPLSADKQRQISTDTREALNRLYETTPGSRELVSKARGVLVFPREIAAGFVVGGAYGEGELRVNNSVTGFYRTATGSVGWQIGAQSRAVIYLFMTQDALDKFRNGNGWAGGVDASVAVLKVGANGAIDANASQAPTQAFVMTNAGLMANVSLEGTKITKIQ